MWLFKVFKEAVVQKKFSVIIVTLISLLISTLFIGGFAYLINHNILSFVYAFVAAVVFMFVFSSELGTKLVLISIYGKAPAFNPENEMTHTFFSIRSLASSVSHKLGNANFFFDNVSELDIMPIGKKLLIFDNSLLDCDDNIKNGAVAFGFHALFWGLGCHIVVCYAANALLLSVLTLWDAAIYAVYSLISGGIIGKIFGALHNIDRALIGVVYGGWIKFATKFFCFEVSGSSNAPLEPVLDKYENELDDYLVAYQSLKG